MGTERKALSSELLAFLERYGVDTDLPDTELVLAATSFLSPIKRGAHEFPEFDGLAVPPLEEKTGDLISARSYRHLQKILDGTFRPALPEFISLMEQVGLQLPPESLGSLLDMAVRDRDLWDLLLPIIGPRGKWLLEQNPSWKEPRKKPVKKNQNWPDDPQTFNEWAQQWLIPGQGMISEELPVYQALLKSEHTWPVAISRYVVEGLQEHLGAIHGMDWQSWHYKDLLIKAGYHSDPYLLSDFQKGWPTERRIWGMWAQEVERFLEILLFRRHMHEAMLQNES